MNTYHFDQIFQKKEDGFFECRKKDMEKLQNTLNYEDGYLLIKGFPMFNTDEDQINCLKNEFFEQKSFILSLIATRRASKRRKKVSRKRLEALFRYKKKNRKKIEKKLKKNFEKKFLFFFYFFLVFYLLSIDTICNAILLNVNSKF